MHALPLLISLACALILAPALLLALQAGAHTRLNYRGRALAFPLGTLSLAAAVVALVPLTLLARLAHVHLFHTETLPIALYSLGVIALGLLDDVVGGRGNAASRRGWRGHWAAARRGEFSTGALKAVGSLGLALLAMGYLRLSSARWLLAAAVLVLATHAFNLLDLRPGRAGKAFVLLGAGLLIGSGQLRPLFSLGLFAGPAAVAGAYELRERAMLGDSGASLLGALAGLWLVLTLSGAGQLVAVALLAFLAIYGELRSLSELIERTPGLRQLDSWGRPS